MRLWKRGVRVEIGGKEISSPEIELDVRRHANVRGAGTIALFNLTPTTVNEIDRDTATTPDVRVYAGYDGNLELLVQGVVRRLEKKRVGISRFVRVHLDDYLGSQTARRAVTSQTWEGEVWIGDIIEHTVSEDMDLDVGHLEAVLPQTSRVENFSWSGKSVDLLEVLLYPRGVDWYVEGETVLFTSRYRPDDTASPLVISPSTGMIGSPTIEENGRARATTFLNPVYQIGRRVHLESEFVDTDYRLAGVRHRGSNRQGPFTSELELFGTDT